MPREIPSSLPSPLSNVAVILILAGCMTRAQATDYPFDYPSSHHYPYRGYGVHETFRLQSKIDRMSAQMRRQQRTLDGLQEEQARLLMQQQSAQNRVTARQACFYRYDGGLDLCDRLFDAKSKEHDTCVEAVIEVNPGCAEDIARATTRSER